MILREIVEITQGVVNQSFDEKIEVNHFSIDSREIIGNTTFIPLSSDPEKRKSHIQNAFENGAIGSFCEEEVPVPDGKFLIKVKDNLQALHTLASKVRENMKNVPLIAITGSVGKTTTKDMVYAVLSSTYTSLKTQGNFNNEIGLPYTLVNYQGEEMIVLEMGMNHFGEISLLTNLAKPDVALITNIGTSHIGNLGSRENILKAKLEILEGMNEKGVLMLNNDNDLLRTVQGIPQKIITVGTQNSCDITAYNIQTYHDHTTFCIQEDGKEYEFNIKLNSEKFVINALLAISVGKYFAIPMDKIQKALEECEYTKMRMSIEKMNGITVIDDCYNASLESIKAALDALNSQNGKRKIAILGDVLELGDYAETLHYEIGKAVGSTNVDMLITIGEHAQTVKKGAMDFGIPSDKIITFEKTDDVLEKLQHILKQEDDVLIKASRGLQFEKIVQKIENLNNK